MKPDNGEWVATKPSATPRVTLSLDYSDPNLYPLNQAKRLTATKPNPNMIKAMIVRPHWLRLGIPS